MPNARQTAIQTIATTEYDLKAGLQGAAEDDQAGCPLDPAWSPTPSPAP
jgi:hypothetical protein